MIKISVAIATFNEEKNIGRCLESVKNIADEIIIIDGSSTDKTVDIAHQYGARVIVTSNPPIFHVNKQKALDQCQGDWILQLDADEVVTPELAKEIRETIQFTDKEIEERKLPPRKEKLFKNHQSILELRDGVFPCRGQFVAFFVARKNLLMGRYLIYGGVYPDGVIRLVKKSYAKFPCKSVHEQLAINGRVGWLENELIHYSTPSFSDYLLRSNRYTSLTAQKYKQKRIQINYVNYVNYVLVKPFMTFLSLYIRHRGFLDGFPGFVFAFFSGLHHATSYLKYVEQEK